MSKTVTRQHAPVNQRQTPLPDYVDLDAIREQHRTEHQTDIERLYAMGRFWGTGQQS